jgi:hypothetical protein
MKRAVGLAIAALLLFGSCATTSRAQGLPSYMEPISGKTTATPSDVTTKDVLALNSAMFDLYDNAARIFQKNLLSKHPVILALFSGAGGRMILYRPGMASTEAQQACPAK